MNAAIDPWVITQREKLKYQEQFKALEPQNGIVTGAQAKGFFLQSQLPPLILGQIWALADTDSDGKMNINEFSIACKLINLKLRGFEIPKVLPPTLIASLSSAAGTPTLTPTGSLSPLDPLKSLNNVTTLPTMPTVPVVPTMPTVPIVPPVPTIPMATVKPPPQGVIPAIPGVPIMPPVAVSNVMASGIVTAPSVGVGMGVGVTPQIPITQTLPGIDNKQPPIIPGQMPLATQPIIPGVQPLVSVPPLIPGTNATAPVVAPLIQGQPSQIIPSTITQQQTGTPALNTVEPIISSPAPPTPPQSNPPSRSTSISERGMPVESPQTEWAIKGPAKLKYTQLFNTTDRTRSGYLTGAQARNIMVQTKLPQAVLAQIWALADMDSDGRLGCEEFVLAMYLCDKALAGEKIPITLPPDLIPPSFRKVGSRHGSISGSRHGSQPGSRHASISSQGAVDADPAAGLPQTSFEDKRKENFDKGQAELDRRRKLLMEQQRKEREERERKEREEAEKKEKARLEAERKQQEELERQLQRQREIEMEKEEQRQRALEAKEAARKELEKQRQLEWEKQRIQEMQLQKEREQENVLKLKAQNQTLNIELSTLNEKIKELTQKICDTRVGVTNVKSIIDGMRTSRDTNMAELAQLKAKIKEQNQKLLQLTQEKAKWDAKAKSGGQFGDQQEQMNAAFANKQIMIKQIKDKIANIREEIESKNADINSNDIQLTELKAELKDLIVKCEELYTTYDTHRNQVLELKHNKKNETYNSAWDTAPSSAWGDSGTTTYESSVIPTTAASTTDIDTQPAPEGFVKYKAIYEFSARNADEISFQPGDIVLVPNEQHAEPGWLAGEINGHTGWFPETYVEKVDTGVADIDVANQISNYNTQDTYVDNKQLGEITETAPADDNVISTITTTTETATAPTTAEISSTTINDATYNGDIEYYIAAYPYASAEAGDLNFNAGEMVMVIKKEGDWWTGTIGTRTGIFPSNYVQKADIGGSGGASTGITDYVQESTIKDTVNGNTQDMNEMKQFNESVTQKLTAEETKTQEDLDIEVSQINTQSKNVEQAETYSRPMSRTSSMTPGMRGKKYDIAQVLAPYESKSPEQLSLQRGQLIMVRKKTDSGWWEGELQAKGRRRQIGWFPASYVKILQGGRNSGRNTPVSGSKIEMTETILDKVIALYSYKAQNDDELSFDKDDIISVLGRDEPEWWRGELNDLTGLFPSNYVGPFVSSGNV